MTDNEDFPNLHPLATALTPVRELHRPLVDAALAWQAERARRTDPDLFALICVGADRAWDDVTPTRWSRTSVYHVLRCDIPNWCSIQRCLLPRGLPEAMWQWFDFLDETGRLDPGGDPLGELRKPLLCYGGLDARGRRLPEGARSTIECECFLPYRETVALLRELGRQAERRGTDPVDLLRHLVGMPPDGSWDGDDPEDGDASWAVPTP